jgi:capsular polysaccharide biosynthesis protein
MLRRRWYAVVVGLVMTVGLGFLATVLIPVSYEAEAQVMLLPPTPVEEPENPYIDLGGLTGVADAVARTMADTDTEQTLKAKGATAEFTVEPDSLAPGPIILITTSDSSPNTALSTLNAIVDLIPENLRTMQVSEDVDTDSLITSTVLSRSSRAEPAIKGQIRALLVAVAAGVALTWIGTAALDAGLRRRQSASGSRPAPPSPGGPVRSPHPSPNPMPGTTVVSDFSQIVTGHPGQPPVPSAMPHQSQAHPQSPVPARMPPPGPHPQPPAPAPTAMPMPARAMEHPARPVGPVTPPMIPTPIPVTPQPRPGPEARPTERPGPEARPTERPGPPALALSTPVVPVPPAPGPVPAPEPTPPTQITEPTPPPDPEPAPPPAEPPTQITEPAPAPADPAPPDPEPAPAPADPEPAPAPAEPPTQITEPAPAPDGDGSGATDQPAGETPSPQPPIETDAVTAKAEDSLPWIPLPGSSQNPSREQDDAAAAPTPRPDE